MNLPPYILNILEQPAALQSALAGFSADSLAPLADRLQSGEFSRLILTGMGSSHNAAYPAWLKLTALPIPVLHLNTAELLHYGRGLLDGRTLLWMNSQSGRSAEVVRLLEDLKDQPPAFLLSLTNDLESPLARSADLVVPLLAGPEATVSTKTYINTLALLLLAAARLIGADWQLLSRQMQAAAAALQAYLADWEAQVAVLDGLLGEVDQLVILGRGASMAAAWNGALIQKEAAKFQSEALNAADFRHGPLEMVSPRLTALVLQGDGRTADLNRALALEILQYGGKAFWLADQTDGRIPSILLPQVAQAVRPLVEIAPLQLLSILLARRAGLVPGAFRYVGKITLQE